MGKHHVKCSHLRSACAQAGQWPRQKLWLIRTAMGRALKTVPRPQKGPLTASVSSHHFPKLRNVTG